MTEPQSWVAPTYLGLADLLSTSTESWDAPSLCVRWTARHVVAHVTMLLRMTPEQFGAEMAAVGGDFTALSNAVADRDVALPVTDLLDQLRSPTLHAWQPPAGGAAGALNHAVIHSLDVTIRSAHRRSRPRRRWPPSCSSSPPRRAPCSGQT